MAEAGKIDPMHQFTVEPLVPLQLGGYDISFTNSSLWLLIALALITGFMLMGMKRQLVPGRWQMAVEGVTGFIDDMVKVNIGPEGKKFMPYIFSLFVFILAANLLGLFPLSIIPGQHQFTTTSHFSITGVLAVMSFAIVLIVGFARHGLHFFSLFVPHGTPKVDGAADRRHRVHLVHGAPVQPGPPTVRGDDRRPHPDGSVRKLHRRTASTAGRSAGASAPSASCSLSA